MAFTCVRVKALKIVDLPTFGSPTNPLLFFLVSIKPHDQHPTIATEDDVDVEDDNAGIAVALLVILDRGNNDGKCDAIHLPETVK